MTVIKGANSLKVTDINKRVCLIKTAPLRSNPSSYIFITKLIIVVNALNGETPIEYNVTFGCVHTFSSQPCLI